MAWVYALVGVILICERRRQAGLRGDTLRHPEVVPRIRALVRAIREGDDAMVEAAVLRISGSQRWLAPLALIVAAFVMLFQGVKLVVVNWRLTTVMILPAMWIWLATFNLKLHVLHGHSYDALRGPILIPLVIAVAAITAGSFYLNAVFAFAISSDGPPEIRPAMATARRHLRVILAWGVGIGLALAFSSLIVTRWGRPWFALAQGVVVGVMMVCYVSVPARLIGVTKPKLSRRDKLAASAISGALGAAVCSPPYVLMRVAILMLGSKFLLIPAMLLFALGAALQAGATGAVKAIKISAGLVAGRPGADEPEQVDRTQMPLAEAPRAPRE
jgi:hypothetical protein